jgi:hypothetical protein
MTLTLNRPPTSGSKAAIANISPETLNAMHMFRLDPEGYARQALPDAIDIKIDSIVMGDRSIPTISVQSAIADSTLIIDRTALAQLQAKIVMKQYPEMQMANGNIVPIDYSREGVSITSSGAEIIETIQVDRIGAMAGITDYTNGGPAVDLLIERMFTFARTIGAQANYSIFELRNSANSKIPLKGTKLEALKEAYLRYIDRGGYYGDPQLGLQGLLTINGTSEYSSPTVFSTALAADTMLAILADMANTITDNTNGIERPKRLVTTERVRNAAIHTRRPNSSKSVYEEFMETERSIDRIGDWITDNHLKGADTNGGDIALLLPNDTDKLCLKVIQQFTMLEEQMRGFGYTVHAFATVGLIHCTRPRAVLKAFGL